MEDDIRLMFPSKFLNAVDLRDRKVPVVIERVGEETMDDPSGKKKTASLIWFKGHRKPLVLCKTQAYWLAKFYGFKARRGWPGKSVVLYPSVCCAFGRENTPCVRIEIDGKTAPPNKSGDNAFVPCGIADAAPQPATVTPAKSAQARLAERVLKEGNTFDDYRAALNDEAADAMGGFEDVPRAIAEEHLKLPGKVVEALSKRT